MCQKSSKWYQRLLGCKSGHGGDTFEILRDNDDTVILCLHKWGEHEHPTLTNPNLPIGNGLILYIRVTDLDKVFQNAVGLKANIQEELHLNPNSGQQQFTLRDLDGYYLMISP